MAVGISQGRFVRAAAPVPATFCRRAEKYPLDDLPFLMEIAVSTALGDESGLLRALRRTARSGISARRIRESIFQQVAFAGVGRTINAMALAQLSLRGGGRRATRDIGPARVRKRGEKVCRRVYGREYPALRAWMRRLDPDLDAWMIDAGYGRVMARPGLDLRTRELLAVAVLAAMRLWPQLRAHLRGARRVGASAAEIRRALAAARRRLSEGDRRRLAEAVRG